MVPRLSDMKYITEYRLWLLFEDGCQGEIDFQPELWGEVFEPLRNIAYFKTVQLDKEHNTICWDNGADFAPEFLYHVVTTGLRSPAA
jgi:hypothetical protein